MRLGGAGCAGGRRASTYDLAHIYSFILAMLCHGTKLNGVQWTPHIMETWIKTLCWPMGYNTYKHQQAQELRNCIHGAVHHLQKLSDTLPEESSHMVLTQSA